MYNGRENMVGLKKVLSLLVVSVLVIGGVTLFGAQTAGDEEGELIDKVDVKLVDDLNEGIGDVYEGEIDLLLHRLEPKDLMKPIPRPELEKWEARTSYYNLLINPSHEGYGTKAMEDAIDASWIDEPEEIRWLANNKDGEWTVNPFAHNDIRFAMQYVDREDMIDQLLYGYGSTRYNYIDRSEEVWKDHFVEAVEEKYALAPEGDREFLEWIIEGAMEEIQEEVAFGEVRHDGDHWQYRAPGEDWHDIEIIIMSRVEDWRLDLGYYFEEILQDLGFDAWVDPVDSTTAIPRAFFGDPDPYDDLGYHMYTGSWVSTQTGYYKGAGAAQMYAPWYGFVQTYGPEEHWQYDDEGYDDPIGPSERVRSELNIWKHANKTVGDLDMRSRDIFEGKVESESDYWEEKIDTSQMGFEESLRVFLLTEFSFYLYNPDHVLDSVVETISGYDSYFGPRTMTTIDGTLEAGIFTGIDRPYMDNWNAYGGSADIYGDYLRKMAREHGSRMHPETGLPMEVNSYWSEGRDTDPWERRGNVKTDYEWIYGELEEYIEIPETAVDYIPAIQTGEDEWEVVREWYTRDELIDAGLIEDGYAAVAVTIDLHEEHVWHDGTDFTIRDVMANYAREKELGNPAEDPFLPRHQAQNSPWWDSIHAIEWNEDGTYTVYGDYTFPMDDKIGSYYEIFPEVHPLTYEGWDHMHGGTEIWDISDVDETYNYEIGIPDNWIHQISPTQCEDLVEVLQTMIDEEYLPYYLDADRGSPIPSDLAEVQATLESIIDFIEEYEHSYISVGPFYIKDYDTDCRSMTFERWDDYGYPFQGEEAEGHEFEYGYWPEQFDISEIRLDHIEEVDPVALGDPIEARGEGHYAQSYPFVDKGPLTEDNMDEWRFTLRRGPNGEILEEVREEDITLIEKDTYSIFEATIPTTNVDRRGHYSLQLEVRGKDEPVFTTIDTYVIVYDPDVDLNVISSEVDDLVSVGQEGNIKAEVENQGEEDDTARIALIDADGEAEMIYEEGVAAGETTNIDHDHMYEEVGEYTLEIWDAEDRFVGFLDHVSVVDIDSVLEVTEWSIPEEVELGEEGTIEATVENVVDFATPVTVYLVEESREEEELIYEEEIGAGETHEIEHEHTFDAVGIYTVEIRDVNGKLVEELGDITVTTLDLYELTIDIEGEGTVEVDHDKEEYEEGTEVVLEAVPDERWYFVEWTGDATGTEKEITVTMDQDRDITAHFEEEDEPEAEFLVTDFGVEVDALEITVTADVENVGEAEGTIELTIEDEVITSLTLEPGESEAIDHTHEVDEVGKYSVELGDRSETVIVEEKVEYDLTINIEGEGSTDPAEGNHTYEEGTEVTITATADDEWLFEEWGGDATGTESTVTITIDEDKEITAIFQEEEDEDDESGIGMIVVILVIVLVAVAYMMMKGGEGSNTEMKDEQTDQESLQ